MRFKHVLEPAHGGHRETRPLLPVDRSIRLAVRLDLCFERLLANLLSSAPGGFNQQRFHLFDACRNRAIRDSFAVGPYITPSEDLVVSRRVCPVSFIPSIDQDVWTPSLGRVLQNNLL